MRAVYPGSFDPATNGHLDIIERSAKLVDHLVVAVLNNINKTSLLTVEERVELLKKITSHLSNVEIKSFSGLLVDFMVKEKSTIIIRGFRAMLDYEYEMQMAQVNRQLYEEVETILLVTKYEYSYLSSSMVKEVAKFGGDVSQFLPKEVSDFLINKFKKSEEKQ